MIQSLSSDLRFLHSIDEITLLDLDRFHGCFVDLGSMRTANPSWIYFFRGSLIGLCDLGPPQVIHWWSRCSFQLNMPPDNEDVCFPLPDVSKYAEAY
jgi:hypothetical protein